MEEETTTDAIVVLTNATTTTKKLTILTEPTTEIVVEKKQPSTTQKTTTTIAAPIPKTKKTLKPIATPNPDEENEIIKIHRPAPPIKDFAEPPRLTTEPEEELIEEVDRQLEAHLSPIKGTQQIVKEASREGGAGFVWIVVGVAGAVVATLLLAVVAVRRAYAAGRCLGIGGMKRSGVGGDSQSDVRFLTSDEVLDFRLAHAGDDGDDAY